MRENFRGCLSPWIFLGAIGVAGCLLTATLLWLYTSRPAPLPKSPATAVLNIIPAPTETPPVPTAPPTIAPTSADATPPPPPPGIIAVGSYVQVSGTGEIGLRLRADPGLQGETRYVGIDAEVFRVTDGPREVDGYTWWYLVAVYDETRRGWGVSNYLGVIQNP